MSLRPIVVVVVIASIILFVAMAVSAQTPPAPATGAAAPPSSPFDAADPEIAKIKQLDWKNANFDALDPKARTEALMALNRGLSMMGAKADSRVELLVDYIDEKDLGQAYASAKSSIPDPTPVTFEMMQKVAAAYVKTPQGSSKFVGQFDNASPDMLNRYLALYDKSARREFEETREARWQVRSMAVFLQEQGKLDDFKNWSVDAQKRRQEELDKAMADQKAAEAQARQERATAAAQQKQQEQQEQAAAQMSAALQYQDSSSYSQQQQQPYVDNDNWWGNPYGWAAYGMYYNSNAYRGYVRDKAQDAYSRWQTGQRPSQLPSQRPAPVRSGGGRAAGGGMRGGGRR